MRRDHQWYEPVSAPNGAEWAIACSWMAVPTGQHRLTPDACTDLICLHDGSLVLCGPERSSWTFQLREGSTAVGVRLRPGMAHVVFGIDVSSITDRRASLTDIVGRELTHQISDSVHRHDGLEARRVELAEQVALVARKQAAIGQANARAFIETVLDALVSSPSATQSQLAELCAFSPRELHRRSLRTFGYGTSTLARLIRFQRFLSIAHAHDFRYRELPTLARLATEAGYSDQAHLSRDCRAITSQTPRAFLAEYFPTFPDLADPYKTSEPLIGTMA